jgi:hypothetical protein
VEHQKVLVYLSSLLTLLSICRVPNCGSLVSQENMKISRNGAMITVHSTCNNNHSEIWESSPRIGKGKGAVALVNVHLAVYSLLVGLHIKQVGLVMLLIFCTLFCIINHNDVAYGGAVGTVLGSIH